MAEETFTNFKHFLGREVHKIELVTQLLSTSDTSIL